MVVQIGKDIGAYTFDKTAKTITITGLTIPSLSDFRVIANATDSTLIYNFADPTQSATWVSATGVLTLEYDTSSMDNADELIILVDIGEVDIDLNLGAKKTISLTPEWARYADVEPLISALQAFTTSFVDLGPEIDCTGYSWVKFWFTLDINQGQDARFKFLQKHTYAGSEEYPICPSKVSISAPATYIETLAGVNAQYFEIDTDADQLFCVTIQVDNATPFLQCQIQIGTDGGTDAEVDAAYVTKGK